MATVTANELSLEKTLEELITEFNTLRGDVSAVTLETLITAASSNIVFEGATDDAYETTLTVVDPTADRTITFPNATGTAITTANSDAPATTTTFGDLDQFLINDGGVLKKMALATVATNLPAITPAAANTYALGSAALEWSDLFLGDSAVINFGNDQDTTLTHADGVGLTLNLMMAATTFEPSGDTSSGDNAAIGYTGTEGLILTGQGSTGDVTIKNDADTIVAYVPTGADDLLFPDNAGLIFGTGSDLKIYHDGSNSYLAKESGTGALISWASAHYIRGSSGEDMIKATTGGAVEAYYANAKKFETTTDGGTLTGTWNVTTAFIPDASDGATLGTVTHEWADLFLADSSSIQFGDDQDVVLTHVPDTGIALADSDKFMLGGGNDMQLYHDGTNSYITNGQGALKVATETSGIAITIGHTTSEVTIGDNLTATGDIAGATVNATGDTSAGDNAAIGYTSGEGLILTGQGSTSDITVKNDADATVFTVPTGTDDILFPDSAKAMWGAGSDLSLYHDGSNSYIDSGAVGSLYMRVNATENAIVAIQNSGVIVYYDGVEKLQTTSAGGTLTGYWNVTTALTPDSSGGADLGNASTEWNDLYLADDSIIYWGNDQDVKLTHYQDNGLRLKSVATGDDKPVVLVLQTGETDIAANDVLGKIEFQAPDEGTGTDSRLIASAIDAVSEGDFSATNNATKLSFRVGVSETATEKMSLSSAGLLTIANSLVIGDGSTIGSSSDVDSITIDASGNVTASQNLTVSGNLSVTGTTTTVNTVTMNAQNAVVFEGATADAHETTLSIVDPTADHTQYLINQGGYIPVLAAATTTAITSTPAELNLLDTAAANSVVNSKAVIYGSSGELAGTLSTAAQANITSVGTLSGLVIANAGNIGSASDTDAMAISSGGVVTFSQTPVFSLDVTIEDDLYLDSDSATIHFGEDGDVQLIHVADSGLRLDDSDKMLFGTSDDMQIFHDGNHSNIIHSGTGTMHLKSSSTTFLDNAALYIRSYDAGETMAVFTDDGSVDLYHNNSKKFETTSAGVTVTGTVTATAGATLLIKNAAGSTLKTIKGMT